MPYENYLKLVFLEKSCAAAGLFTYVDTTQVYILSAVEREDIVGSSTSSDTATKPTENVQKMMQMQI